MKHKQKMIKNIMKKGTALCMAGVMVFGMTACGGKQKTSSSRQKTAAESSKTTAGKKPGSTTASSPSGTSAQKSAGTGQSKSTTGTSTAGSSQSKSTTGSGKGSTTASGSKSVQEKKNTGSAQNQTSAGSTVLIWVGTRMWDIVHLMIFLQGSGVSSSLILRQGVSYLYGKETGGFRKAGTLSGTGRYPHP